MSDIYIFAGPTIPVAEARRLLKATYLPPVAQGEFYRVALKKPVAMGIIDGYFQHIPSVWHKEILWALSQGIHVFGAASMGALRAAELESFGMEGVGKVFEAYKTGTLEDDDEVAVVHGPASLSFKPSTEAMVNIRSTLEKAELEGIVDPSTASSLVALAKRLHFTQRTYAALFQLGKQHNLNEEVLSAFQNWLPHNKVDQKRIDAENMLGTMTSRFSDTTAVAPKEVHFSFAFTEMFDHERRTSEAPDFNVKASNFQTSSAQVLDELRLDPAAFEKTRMEAGLRLLMIEETHRLGLKVTKDMLQEALSTVCSRLGLSGDEQLKDWLDQQQLTSAQFSTFLEDEARFFWMRNLLDSEIMHRIPAFLKLSGQYADLYSRAADKQLTLTSAGLSNPALEDADLSEEELIQWHFEKHLHRPVPDPLAPFLHRMGYSGKEEFLHLLLREYCFQQIKGNSSRRLG